MKNKQKLQSDLNTLLAQKAQLDEQIKQINAMLGGYNLAEQDLKAQETEE